MNSLETLIAGLEDVEIGTGELDAEIEAAISEWRNLGGWWREHKVTGATEQYNYRSPPHYSTSLDAALTLVPEGLLTKMDWTKHVARAFLIDNRKGVDATGIGARAPTPALALCIACLKARGD